MDEVVLHQQAPGRDFTTHVQLLETADGERLVRLAYSTAEQGAVRRGPVTMTTEGLGRLLAELSGHEELAAVFGLNGGARPRRPSGRGRRRRASPG